MTKVPKDKNSKGLVEFSVILLQTSTRLRCKVFLKIARKFICIFMQPKTASIHSVILVTSLSIAIKDFRFS